ncbi:MAG: hypothetical protein E6212_09440, partial [Actinomyces sp.]|nr:hypothetical protein [Actinomyces sp.]
MRIGYDDADSLLTYPDAPFLSGYTVPIRMRRHKSTNRQAHVVSQAENQPDAHLLIDPTHHTRSRG